MIKTKRLSVQICRVLAIVECLQSRTADIEVISQHVNQTIPSPVSERTIRRDVDALITLGYCQQHKISHHARSSFSISWPVRNIAIVETTVIPPKRVRKESQFRRLVAEGCTNAEIAQILKISHASAIKWRKQFGL
jgi:DNA-binding NarL/FixJ family response regulator